MALPQSPLLVVSKLIKLIMILTREIIEQGKSERGGWSSDQFFCLGISKNDKTKGWIKRLVGQDFSEENIKQFLILKKIILN